MLRSLAEGRTLTGGSLCWEYRSVAFIIVAMFAFDLLNGKWVLVLAQLALQPGQVVWDVGAGNGSVDRNCSVYSRSLRCTLIENGFCTNAIEFNYGRFTGKYL